MEAAAFCLSHPSLIPPKSSLHFTSKNRTLISYSYSSLTTTTTTTKQQHYLSCTTNSYKQHDLSCFRSNSFTGVRPRRYVFRPTICAVDGSRVPRKDIGSDDDDSDKKPGIIAGLSTTVVLACTVVGTIMFLNGRLMQAKALINIPAGLHDDQNINKLMTTSMNKMDNFNPFSRGRDQSSELPPSDSSRSSAFSISKLKEDALSMAPDKAIKELISQYEATMKKQDIARAHDIEMLLVEILIRQGKYKEALSRSCLSEIKTPNDALMSDIRIYVYKTFLYVMTDDNVQAKIWCKGLLENFEKMGPPRKQLMSFND